MLPEYPLDRDSFGKVIVVGPGAVGIDIIDFTGMNPGGNPVPASSTGKARSHRGMKRSGDRRRWHWHNPREFTKRGAAAEGFFRFQHQESGAFAEVQPHAAFIERPAVLLVEDHQRVEAVEGEFRHGIGAAGKRPGRACRV